MSAACMIEHDIRSTSAVPPNTCLLHGSYHGFFCPSCSTAVHPQPVAIPFPVRTIPHFPATGHRP